MTMMMNSQNCFVCLVVTIAIFFGTVYGHNPSTVVVERTQWNMVQRESSSHFVCGLNQVIIGRKHYGHHNAPTWYMCGKLVNDGHQFEVPPSTLEWSNYQKESSSFFTCPFGQVMTGREHMGDEHGLTKHQCSEVQYKGKFISFTAHHWSPNIEEHSSTFICPTNHVMIGRRRSVHGVAYQCAMFTGSFSTTPLLPQYAGENSACVWQDEFKCPPFVTYYDEKQRHSLALFVHNNHIVNTQGHHFDTKDADDSHGGKKAAIFTMSAFGDLYASNSHKVYMFHHSTIFAGEPVAAAGEIVAKHGKIQLMTDCSGHYRPQREITRQAITALSLQGYTRPIPFTSCTLLQYDYMILKSGVRPSPAELGFTAFDSALLGPGTTVVCGKGSESDFCRAPIALRVPSFTTIQLCFYNEICKLYNEGTHRLSDGVVKYSDFKILAKNNEN